MRGFPAAAKYRLDTKGDRAEHSSKANVKRNRRIVYRDARA
jgi:hypothetical protein